jgi:hypothetical protein
VETLVDENGDCEDTSILYASIMEALGYDAVILVYLGNPGHAAVGIAGEGYAGTYYTFGEVDYYYCETTTQGWKMGEIPFIYEGVPAIIVQVS